MHRIAGNDISKKTIDIDFTGKSLRVSNDRKGHERAFKSCKGAELFVMEATSSYHVDFADFLVGQGAQVAVVNPSRSAHYAKALGKKNKTDRADAKILAEFASKNELDLYVPASPEMRRLRSLVRHRSRLANTAAEAKTTLRDPGLDDWEIADVKEQLALLKKQMAKLEAEIRSLVKGSPELEQSAELFHSIPGIGETTAWIILAETKDLSRFENAKKLAAFAGVQPTLRHSGTSLRWDGAMSKNGNAILRRALYMCSLSLIRREGPFKEFFLRLVQRGKAKKSAIGAVMHKLIRVVFGVWASKRPFSLEKMGLTNP